MVCCGLPAARGVGHLAPSIRLGDLDSSIAAAAERRGNPIFDGAMSNKAPVDFQLKPLRTCG
jgi:hypothetical protein